MTVSGNHPTSPNRRLHPRDVIEDALRRFDRIAISFSGAEDVVLIDMAAQLGMPVEVFSLDTGRLHSETWRFIEQVRSHYGIAIELLTPDPAAVANLTRTRGLFSFYEDGHQECCAIRKVEPLRRKLATLDAWITGQRRDQSTTRADIPHEQLDATFGSDEHPVYKFNPLAAWTSEEVWAWIRERAVPYNALHDRGFVSIGCEPCTRPIGPHEHERAGRWWWEADNSSECGLHVVDADAAIQPVRVLAP